MRAVLLAIPFLVACHHDTRETEDPEETLPEDDTSVDYSCDELEIGFDGPEPPHVGDSWDLQLWCDGGLMTVVVISLDPTDFASRQDFRITFLETGTGTLTMQAGSQVVEKEITVEK